MGGSKTTKLSAEEQMERTQKQLTIVETLEKVINKSNLKPTSLVINFLNSIKTNIAADQSTSTNIQIAIASNAITVMRKMLDKSVFTLSNKRVNREEKDLYYLLRTEANEFLKPYYILVNAIFIDAKNTSSDPEQLKSILETTLKFINENIKTSEPDGDLLLPLANSLKTLIKRYEQEIKAKEEKQEKETHITAKKTEAEQIKSEIANLILERLSKLRTVFEPFKKSLQNADIAHLTIEHLINYFSSPEFVMKVKKELLDKKLKGKEDPNLETLKKLFAYDKHGNFDSEETKNNMKDYFAEFYGEAANKIFYGEDPQDLYKKNSTHLAQISQLLSIVENNFTDFITYEYKSAIKKATNTIEQGLKENAARKNKVATDKYEARIKVLEDQLKDMPDLNDFSTKLADCNKILINNSDSKQSSRSLTLKDKNTSLQFTEVEPVFHFTTQRNDVNNLSVFLKNNRLVELKHFKDWKKNNLNEVTLLNEYIKDKWYARFGRISEFFVKKFPKNFNKYCSQQTENAEAIYTEYNRERARYTQIKSEYDVRKFEHENNELIKKFNNLVNADLAVTIPNSENKSYLYEVKNDFDDLQEKFKNLLSNFNAADTPSGQLAVVNDAFLKEISDVHNEFVTKLKSLNQEYYNYKKIYLTAEASYTSAIELQSSNSHITNIPTLKELNAMESNLKQCRVMLDKMEKLTKALQQLEETSLKTKQTAKVQTEINALKKEISKLNNSSEVTPQLVQEALEKETPAIKAAFIEATKTPENSLSTIQESNKPVPQPKTSLTLTGK